MAIHVYSLVENSHHIDSAITRAIKNHMPTDAAPAVALANRTASASQSHLWKTVCYSRMPASALLGNNSYSGNVQNTAVVDAVQTIAISIFTGGSGR